MCDEVWWGTPVGLRPNCPNIKVRSMYRTPVVCCGMGLLMCLAHKVPNVWDQSLTRDTHRPKLVYHFCVHFSCNCIDNSKTIDNG
jgi:hypothetical protein